MSKIKIVTIGRLYCSGGSDIGKMVAEKLGIPCYDREIIEMAAKKSGISMDEIKKYEESILHPLKTPIRVFGKGDEEGSLRYRGQVRRLHTEKQGQDTQRVHLLIK